MKVLIVALVLVGAQAFALKVDDGKGDSTYRLNGKEISAIEATKAALDGAKVMKCKPKASGKGKVFFAANGQAIGEVVECTPQEAVISTKGGIRLKAVK